MAIGANSYGSVAEVAALTRRYANSSGAYDTTTKPTMAQVEKFLDRMSAALNTLLAKEGFAIPISQDDAKLLCDEIVVECAVELCNIANSTGRFFTDKALSAGKSPLNTLLSEMAAWLEANAAGLEALGADRSRSLLDGIAFRGSDNSGDAVPPLFPREAYGEAYKEWDET